MSYAGYPATVSLAAASPDAMGGPFTSNPAAASAPPAALEGVPPSEGGGLSKGKKDTAIAVPVILGALIAACGSLCNHVSVDLLMCFVVWPASLSHAETHVRPGLCFNLRPPARDGVGGGGEPPWREVICKTCCMYYRARLPVAAECSAQCSQEV